MNDCSPRHPFSLVELLVVISIIAILAGMLMPALGQSRRTAQKIKCINNLHQIGLGALLYCGDNRGFFPPQGGMGYSMDHYWWGKKQNTTEWDFSRGYVSKYVLLKNGDGILDCPAMPWGSYASLNGGIDIRTTVYGYNGVGLCPPASGWGALKYPWQRAGRIKKPSSLLMFGDSAMVYFGSSVLTSTCLLDPPKCPPWLGGSSWYDNNTGTTHFRHNGRAVHVLVDGHSEELVATKETSPNAALGKIGFAGELECYVPYL